MHRSIQRKEGRMNVSKKQVRRKERKERKGNSQNHTYISTRTFDIVGRCCCWSEFVDV